MSYLIVSISFLVLTIVPAFLKNTTLTVLCLAGSFIFLVVWFVSKPRISLGMVFLFPYLSIAGGILLLAISNFGELLGEITHPKLFFNKLYQVFIERPDAGETAGLFLLFILPLWILGIGLIITGLLWLYHRHLKSRIGQKNNA